MDVRFAPVMCRFQLSQALGTPSDLSGNLRGLHFSHKAPIDHCRWARARSRRPSWRPAASRPSMNSACRRGRTLTRVGLPTKLSRGSHPSLPHERLPSFIADLRARDATAAPALEFLILTNVGADAVLKARWDELDLDQALWSVPLANMKDRKFRKEAFRAPLPSRPSRVWVANPLSQPIEGLSQAN